MVSDEGLDLIDMYFPELSEQQKGQMDALGDQYKYWNERVNLISRKDYPHLFLRHVLHSLAIGKVWSTEGVSQQILDLGTGGGFPGLPLAICYPTYQFHLVDSVGKKIKIVNEIIRTLGLQNVVTYVSRVEHLQLPVQIVVSRAVAPTAKQLKWLIKMNSIQRLYLLKGGDLNDELSLVKSWSVRIHHIRDYFKHPFFESKLIVELEREMTLS